MAQPSQSTLKGQRGPNPAELAARFRAIYEAEFSYVWHSLRRLGAHSGDLEDLTHDVFITAHRRMSDYNPSRPIRPWLFGIAYRTFSDFRRMARHIREVSDEQADTADERPAADERLSAAQDRQLLHDALEVLDENKRVVFVMHELNAHSIPEVAEVVGIPLNTAYSRLRLARVEVAAAVKRISLQRGGR